MKRPTERVCGSSEAICNLRQFNAPQDKWRNCTMWNNGTASIQLRNKNARTRNKIEGMMWCAFAKHRWEGHRWNRNQTNWCVNLVLVYAGTINLHEINGWRAKGIRNGKNWIYTEKNRRRWPPSHRIASYTPSRTIDILRRYFSVKNIWIRCRRVNVENGGNLQREWEKLGHKSRFPMN